MPIGSKSIGAAAKSGAPIGFLSMGIAAHHRLLSHQQRDEGPPMPGLLQLPEQRLVIARHREDMRGLPDEFLAAGALPTLHDRYGISTQAMSGSIKSWL